MAARHDPRYNNFVKWMALLRMFSDEKGYGELVGVYHYHIASYVDGLTPEQEIERLLLLENCN
jgi:hypothetical protein